MKPRVVLAGGSGFLGRALAEALLAKGCEVVVLSRGQELHPPRRGRHMPGIGMAATVVTDGMAAAAIGAAITTAVGAPG